MSHSYDYLAAVLDEMAKSEPNELKREALAHGAVQCRRRHRHRHRVAHAARREMSADTKGGEA